MQATNTALSSELVRCTVAFLNRSEWEGAGNAVTPQLKSGWRSKEGKKFPPPPTSPPKKNYIDQKLIAGKKKEIPCWISDPLVKFFHKGLNDITHRKWKWDVCGGPKSTLQILLPKKIERKTFKTSQNTSVISDTLTSTPPLPGT